MKFKPRIFIGSSSEGLKIAEYVKEQLGNEFDCYLWTDNIFKYNDSAFDTLLNEASFFDFGILIATPDDFTTSREKTFETARDNIIFEFGLFIARLGKSRAFILQEKSTKLPSDLLGITVPRFEIDGEVYQSTSLNEEIKRIRSTINEKIELGELGLLPSTPLAIGYFENFVKNVCHSLQASSKMEVEGQAFTDFELNIVMPGDLDSDIKNRATIYFRKNSLNQVPLNCSGRSYPVFVAYDAEQKQLLRLYDMPTTLLGIDQAIELYMKKGHVGKSREQKLLEERELRNFERTLRILINNDAFCRNVVRIISE